MIGFIIVGLIVLISVVTIAIAMSERCRSCGRRLYPEEAHDLSGRCVDCM